MSSADGNAVGANHADQSTAFCTIITWNYMEYAVTLYHSLREYEPAVDFHVLVVDRDYVEYPGLCETYPNLTIHFCETICGHGLGAAILKKYGGASADCTRWSLKPVFLSYLISRGYDQAFFLDPDLYFYSSPRILLEELGNQGILLTPHWRSSDPDRDRVNFAILQTSGLFNAGCVGATEAGLRGLEWWARVCLHECVKAPERGLFVDQAYLDLLPIYFESVKILRHRGCNVANWNQIECQREENQPGVITINGFPLVFVHFTASTIHGIEAGDDPLLRDHLARYRAALDANKKWALPLQEAETGGDAGGAPLGQIKKIVLAALHRLPGFSGLERSFLRRFSSGARWQLPSRRMMQKSHPATDPMASFLAPRCDVQGLDRYLIRRAILCALLSQRDRLRGTLLDVGCGQMPYRSILTGPDGQVTGYLGLDFAVNPIHDNQPDLCWENGRIPLADASVDSALCTEVLEHCPDPDAVLSEVARVLRPGGCLLFSVPFLWPLHEVPYDHYRYTPFALRRHLTKAGFGSIQIQAMGGWDASLAQMLGLWVRRRPMGRLRRALLSLLVYPLYRWLVQADGRAAVEFTESQMLTGLWGTAVKPGKQKSEPPSMQQAAAE
jgi:SAM-dependent methyltransferase